MDFSKLREPFPPAEIEWRVGRSGANGDKPWAMVLAYVQNRAIMNRLDDVCGPDKWKNEFLPAPLGGILCGISIKCGDEWITKYDGADNTQIEATKGGLSDSMKRAAVQWGIGRYLYNLESGWAVISPKGKYKGDAKPRGSNNKIYFKWDPPPLPHWALPPAPKPPKIEWAMSESAREGLKSELAKMDIKLTGAVCKQWNINPQTTDQQSLEILKQIKLSVAKNIQGATDEPKTD